MTIEAGKDKGPRRRNRWGRVLAAMTLGMAPLAEKAMAQGEPASGKLEEILDSLDDDPKKDFIPAEPSSVSPGGEWKEPAPFLGEGQDIAHMRAEVERLDEELERLIDQRRDVRRELRPFERIQGHTPLLNSVGGIARGRGITSPGYRALEKLEDPFQESLDEINERVRANWNARFELERHLRNLDGRPAIDHGRFVERLNDCVTDHGSCRWREGRW